MSDHSQYEELAALAAGGYLDGDELRDFQRHCGELRPMQERGRTVR